MGWERRQWATLAEPFPWRAFEGEINRTTQPLGQGGPSVKPIVLSIWTAYREWNRQHPWWSAGAFGILLGGISFLVGSFLGSERGTLGAFLFPFFGFFVVGGSLGWLAKHQRG